MAGGHLGDLERVGEPGALVVVGEDEHLGLAGQAAERGGVQDAVAVALEAGAQRIGLLLGRARAPGAPRPGWRPAASSASSASSRAARRTARRPAPRADRARRGRCGRRRQPKPATWRPIGIVRSPWSEAHRALTAYRSRQRPTVPGRKLTISRSGDFPLNLWRWVRPISDRTCDRQVTSWVRCDGHCGRSAAPAAASHAGRDRRGAHRGRDHHAAAPHPRHRDHRVRPGLLGHADRLGEPPRRAPAPPSPTRAVGLRRAGRRRGRVRAGRPHDAAPRISCGSTASSATARQDQGAPDGLHRTSTGCTVDCSKYTWDTAPNWVLGPATDVALVHRSMNACTLPLDELGVRVKVRHDMVTGLFGDVDHLTDKAIMRLEPQPCRSARRQSDATLPYVTPPRRAPKRRHAQGDDGGFVLACRPSLMVCSLLIVWPASRSTGQLVVAGAEGAEARPTRPPWPAWSTCPTTYATGHVDGDGPTVDPQRLHRRRNATVSRARAVADAAAGRGEPSVDQLLRPASSAFNGRTIIPRTAVAELPGLGAHGQPRALPRPGPQTGGHLEQLWLEHRRAGHATRVGRPLHRRRLRLGHLRLRRARRQHEYLKDNSGTTNEGYVLRHPR